MSDRHSVTTNETIVPRQRFSLISFFTNNRSSRKSRKQKNQAKNKAKDAESASLASSTKNVQTSGRSTRESRSAPLVAATTDVRAATNTSDKRLCPLCYEEMPNDCFPELSLPCDHRSCQACMEQYLKIEIGESRVDVACPECPERLHPTDIQKVLKSEKHMSKYEEFMLRRVLINDPDSRWCPAPDCGYAVIARGCAGCPMLRCERPGCNTLFCYHCKQEWHANQTCDMARYERLPLLRISLSDTNPHTIEEYKPCPRCNTIINKMDDGSCNHMTCSMCHAQFCWLCLKEASDLHYLSPSGCTFWGKKPWSRKKKILWQLGTLIGAPVGIALIAGLSVPLFVIGLPIVTGRKLFRKFKDSNKHRRNAAVTFGTFAALVFSPVVAALTIAIGVPILLFYVYGVVPISLCRGGTCGVKNENGSLTFDFGKNFGENASIKTAVDVEGGMVGVGNPSIGPSIGEASLVTVNHSLSASGIQMDHIGLTDDQSDRRSASIRNLAGTSVTGSIYDPETAAHQKLEVQADVNQPIRAARKNSMDSVHTLSNADSRSLGPDTRSIRSFGHDTRSHVSFNFDNSSLKALAGSLSAQRDHDGVSVTLSCEPNADVKSRSCMKADHGSPVSNRSVSFAMRDEASHKSKKREKKRRGDRISQKSFDALSNTSYELALSRKHSGDSTKHRTVEPTVSFKHEADVKSEGTPHCLPEVDSEKPTCSTTSQVKKTPGSNEGAILSNIIEDK